MVSATMGEALAHKRVELGLEKGQAAQRIGMSRTTYSSYEQDAQRPSVEVFPKIASFLDISMEEVLTLYGATCVVQARNFLARVTQDPSSESGDVQLAKDVTPTTTADERETDDAPTADVVVSTTPGESPDESTEAIFKEKSSVKGDDTIEVVDGPTAFSSVEYSSPTSGAGPGPGSKAKKKKKKKKHKGD
jgi:transcriptional regulator with XRE-family HTH domain